MNARYTRNRAAAIVLLGEKCIDCKTGDDLQFDHVNARSKEHEIGILLSGYPRPLLFRELAKCVLRCRPCHDIKTAARRENTGGGWNKLPDDKYVHGTERMYNYGKCRCGACRAARQLYRKGRIRVDEVVTPDDAAGLRILKQAKGTHGTISAYRWCGPPKCEACKKAKREAMRAWLKSKHENTQPQSR